MHIPNHVSDFVLGMGKKARKPFRVCPETGKPIPQARFRWARWLFPITGLAALFWFLIRVIPKPTRATYPCQRIAAPLASGFIVWLLSLAGSTLAYRKASSLLKKTRYCSAIVFVSLAVFLIWLPLSMTNTPAYSTPTDPC